MTPDRLDHLVLEVKDVERSLTFYCDVLGLKAERLTEFREGHAPFVSLRVGQSLIDLFPSESPIDGPNHFCLAFQDPIETILDTLRQGGLSPTTPDRRFGAEGMGLSVYVDDPDGHTVEIRTYG